MEYRLVEKWEHDELVNLSGITYNADRDSLFLILNEPARVYEMSKKGDLLSSWDLEGFDDTEDIYWMGGNVYVVCEESHHSLEFIRLEDGNKKAAVVFKREPIGYPTLKGNSFNKGLEGVVSHEGKFYVVSEMPAKVHWSPQLEDEERIKMVGDLSAITHHRDNFYLLSDKSARVLSGKQNDWQVFMYFQEGMHGLEQGIPQAEGLCFDTEDVLYVCSEPDLIYVFKK